MAKELTHLGLIMDGNGRWATKRGLPRTAGHLEGLKALKKVIKGCIANDIRYLTLYCFSTENWKRPAAEVNYLMALFTNKIYSEMVSQIQFLIIIMTVFEMSNFAIFREIASLKKGKISLQ